MTTVLGSGATVTGYLHSLANITAKREATKQFLLLRLAAKHPPSEDDKYRIGSICNTKPKLLIIGSTFEEFLVLGP